MIARHAEGLLKGSPDLYEEIASVREQLGLLVASSLGAKEVDRATPSRRYNEGQESCDNSEEQGGNDE